MNQDVQHLQKICEVISRDIPGIAPNDASSIDPNPQLSISKSEDESSRDPQQQLKTIAGDLAIVRRIIEQIAVRQDQMARDIATLQAAEQSVSQKISAPLSVSDHPHKAEQKE